MSPFKALSVFVFVCFLSVYGSGCGENQSPDEKPVLYLFSDTVTNQSGYKNQKGEVVIPAGKYGFCFTDTFSKYAIVAGKDGKLMGINQEEKKLYEVFKFDNGPDAPSEGLFRILEGGKFGYADLQSGEVVISPQFDCAYPFEGGRAKVAKGCKSVADGENTVWEGGDWFFVNKKGEKVAQ